MTDPTTHPLQALMTAVFNRLSSGGYIWGARVSEVIQPNWGKPYCQVYYVSGEEPNFLRTQDATFELGVKVIAETQQQSMAGAAQIIAALNDQGEQDQPDNPLDGGDEWMITTSTQGRMLHQIEMFSNAQPIYHDGAIFEFVLGLRSS